ncbi:MAG: hypothetical protein HY912_11180 [Desulfomonile tiedjei]|uniref:Uncharacterized protein n=1 Tax=Desulfomonile tiedjei TaxID=2358 RepID=A0A9D6Z3Z1_9BACT|nr:hypothetical protein [Desulfomonile tiedjei]
MGISRGWHGRASRLPPALRRVLIERQEQKNEQGTLLGSVGSPENEARLEGSSCGFTWQSRSAVFGIPLICVTTGTDSRGRRRVAKGILAIGRYAVGGIAIGQFGLGVVAIGQLSLGLFAFGQLALAALLGAGQVSGGLLAFGQAVFGLYGFGQIGWATYLWTPQVTDMEAVSMFYTIKMMVLQEGGITPGEVVRGGLEWASKWIRDMF